jgi:hypothetical protein
LLAKWVYQLVILQKKALQIFCATDECDNDSKKWCFLLKWMVTKKLCDTNKNVTKMGVIIKGVYCISSLPAKAGNVTLQIYDQIYGLIETLSKKNPLFERDVEK